MNLKHIYQQLKDVKGDPAVSIFVPTHRTFPDNEKDSIALKNALTETENRLFELYEKRPVWAIMEKINKEFEHHQHNYNLDTLAVFATPEEVHVHAFPFHVVPRVVIDDNFALRDLVREDLQALHYYILTVSRSEARLYEVFNDSLIKEFTGEDKFNTGLTFPMKNSVGSSERTADDRANGIAEENLYREFLNRVDKNVQELYRDTPLPVFVAGDDKAVGFYQQECDDVRVIGGTLTSTENVEWDARLLIEDLQETVQAHQLEQEKLAVEQIGQTRGQNLLMADLASIYRSAIEGRVDTLFVRKGYVMPAQVDKENWNIVTDLPEDAVADTDDVVDDIIDTVLQNGGQVSFIRPELFDEGENVLAKLRY